MALERTPDMEGLSPSERAAIYKQRAAAAGIGQPPSAASGAAPAPRPAAQPAAAAAPAPAAAAAVAERPAGAGVPAKVAAAATARREQVAAVARREPAPAAAEQSERLVYVWPHLVTIEFMSAVLLLLSIVVVCIILQAPLEAHANPDRTPNPSKAPWYFLNLQELLLHMHPSLAGVLIPAGVVFVAIPLIPYFDRDTADVGRWFGTAKAVPICIFTAVYSTIVLIALVLFDERIGVKPMMQAIATSTGIPFFADTNPLGIGALSMPNVIVPMILMNGPIVILLLLIRAIYKPRGVRDYMFALFTGFVVAYVVLTIVGSFFRGEQMILMWPWDPRQARLD
ncbi:MAG: menaquinol-cytochrome C reductase [Chloroflexi bacterium]|nr:menaquinol-cytochrome C reductase [Chloroflexota bacterium]MBV9601199.1 menaquinol-cytochrome C reductase [Chloroflexota bacterium]